MTTTPHRKLEKRRVALENKICRLEQQQERTSLLFSKVQRKEKIEGSKLSSSSYRSSRMLKKSEQQLISLTAYENKQLSISKLELTQITEQINTQQKERKDHRTLGFTLGIFALLMIGILLTGIFTSADFSSAGFSLDSLLGFSQPTITGATVNGVGIEGKHQFKAGEQPQFKVILEQKSKTNLLTGQAIGILGDDVRVILINPQGEETILDKEILQIDEGLDIVLEQGRDFHAGVYILQVEQNNEIILEQEFMWGVLAINTHKSIYLPNEEAFIGMAVLDDLGGMVCDADVVLEIIAADGTATTLSTQDGEISVSEECEIYGVTNLPDYYTNYVVSEVGIYSMNLTAVTPNGVRSIVDWFVVQEIVEFDVARAGPTRIYPFVPYTMDFTIQANEDYSGLIEEIVPASFEITPQPWLNITLVDDIKILSWNRELLVGESYTLSYEFDAPDISPEFYVLGPLQIGEWQEGRQWQIASDANLTHTHFTSTCAAANEAAVANSYPDACDDPTGANIETDGGGVETQTFSKSGPTTTFGGLRIESVNESVNSCADILTVELCYEWWADTGQTGSCDISVDRNGDGIYDQVSAVCPDTTANPGVTCTDVSALDGGNWNCSVFFSADSSNATARLNLERSAGNGIATLTTDVFFFNVTYNETAIPIIVDVNATPKLVFAGENVTLRANATSSSKTISAVLAEINGINYTMNAPGIIANKSESLRTQSASSSNGAALVDLAGDGSTISYAILKPDENVLFANIYDEYDTIGTINNVTLNILLKVKNEGDNTTLNISWFDPENPSGAINRTFTGLAGKETLLSYDVTSERAWSGAGMFRTEIRAYYESGNSLVYIKEAWFDVQYEHNESFWSLDYNTTGLDGLVNFTVYANDSLNFEAVQNVSNFTVSTNITVEELVEDALEDVLNSTMTITAADNSIIYNETAFFHTRDMPQGNYTFVIEPLDHVVSRIEINTLNVTSDINNELVQLDDPVNANFMELFAVNVSVPATNYSNISISLNATGTKLYECTAWNFSQQRCDGYWVNVSAISPGGQYNVSSPGGYAQTGLIAINTHKSIYLPDELANISMGVLNNNGGVECSANVTLDVSNSSSSTTTLTTVGGDIVVSSHCSALNVTDVPDYFTNYTVGGVGTYLMNASAVINDSLNPNVSSHFVVQSSVEFDVARETATRIVALENYTVNFTIVANRDFVGNVTEVVDPLFNITAQDGLTIEQYENYTLLHFNVSFVNGSTYRFGYEYLPPDVSPELFLLGPLRIGNFTESRAWQIAADGIVARDDSTVSSADPVVELETFDIVTTLDTGQGGGGGDSGSFTILFGTDTGSSTDDSDGGTTITDTCGTFRVTARANTCGAEIDCSDNADGYSIDYTVNSKSTNTHTITWTVEACSGSAGSDYDIGPDASGASNFDSWADAITVAIVSPNVTALIPVADSTFNTSQVIEIGANVTDDGAVSDVYVNITYPNGTVEELILSNDTLADKYNASFTIPLITGFYNVTFYANDSGNTFNSTESTNFTVPNIGCGTIDNDTTMDQDVTSTGNCFTMVKSHITLDCAGYVINYGADTSSNANGVRSVSIYNNLTIKNCYIRMAGSNFSVGLHVGVLLDPSSSSTILNNTISTNGSSNNYGIRVDYTQDNIITNNTIETSGSFISGDNHGLFILGSINNNITGNIIKTNGTHDNYGISLIRSNGTFVQNNTIRTNGTSDSNIGINITGSLDTLILNNNITTNGVGTRHSGISLDGSNTTLIQSNIINTGKGVGLELNDQSFNNTFVNNNITTPGYLIIDDGSQADFVNYLVYNSSWGEISWMDNGTGSFLRNLTLNLSGNNNSFGLGLNLHIDNNTAALNTSAFDLDVSRINSSANITLKGIGLSDVVEIRRLETFTTNETEIQEDGVNCNATGCSIISYDAGSGLLLFNTSFFSSFVANETEKPVECGTLTKDTTMNQDVSSVSSCFDIGADDITLDCAGYVVTFGTVNRGFGVNNSNGYDGVTIKNCYLRKGSTISNGANLGILFTNGAENGTILNNTISNNGTFVNYGINVDNGSGTTIANNTIQTSGNNVANYGIHVKTSDDVEVIGNIISTNGTGSNNVIFTNSVNRVLIQNNTITSNGTANFNYGINLFLSHDNIVIENNVSATWGTTENYGLRLSGSNNTLLQDNIFMPGGSGGSNAGIRLDGISSNNTFVNNNITAAMNSLVIDDVTSVDYVNYLVYNNSWGEISWMDNSTGSFLRNLTLNLSGNNNSFGLGMNLHIDNNTAALNTSAFDLTESRINSSANITLRGVGLSEVNGIKKLETFTTNETEIQEDGTDCVGTSCEIISYDAGSGLLLFNTSFFSSFSANETATDNAPPTVAITTPTLDSPRANFSTGNNTVNATIDDATSDTLNVFFSFNNASDNSDGLAFNMTATNISGNWGAYFNATSLVEGSHLVQVYANDSLNNLNSSENVSFYVDRTAPIVNFGQLTTNSTNTKDTTPDIQFNFTDNVFHNLSCSLYVDNLLNATNTAVVNNTNTNLTFDSSLAPGSYQYNVNCTDGSSNVGNSSIFTLTVLLFSIENVVLNTTNITKNDTTQNLTAYWDISGAEGDDIQNITTWKVNDTTIATVIMPFEQINGSTTDNAYDYSRRSNNGTVSGAVWNSTSGWRGTSYTFDGSNDEINLRSQPIDSLIGDQFTITFWVNPPAADRPTFGFQGSGGFNRDNPVASYDDALTFGDGSDHQLMTALSDAPADTWTFYSIVDNGTNYTVYVNATEIEQVAIEINPADTINRTFTLGQSGFNPSFDDWFKGNFDELTIYNRSLSQQQLEELYNGSLRIITSDQTSLGNKWSICVTSNNGVQDVDQACSNNVTIGTGVAESDTTSPAVTALIPINGSLLNTSLKIEIAANVTDASSISNVTVNITFPNGSVEAVTLSPSSGTDKFNITYIVPDLPGFYNVSFYANDSENNENLTEHTNFTTKIGCGVIINDTTMDQNATATGTCFTIGAHNIVLDCIGYSINYSASSTAGYGINNTDEGYDNVTIRNCIIGEGIATAGSHAIYLANLENNTIQNNSLLTIGSNSYGVNLETATGNNSLINNNITSISAEINDGTGSSYLNYLIYNNSWGEIRWIDNETAGFLRNLTFNATNDQGIGLGKNIFINNNTASFNVTAFNGSINSSVNITLQGLAVSTIHNIVGESTFSLNEFFIRRNGVGCNGTSCLILSYSGGTLVFNTSFLASFSSNTLPAAPINVTPPTANNTINRTPSFTWNNSIDPNNDNVTYNLIIDDSRLFNNPEINVTGIANTTAENTTYILTTELAVDTTYFWKVYANDSQGQSLANTSISNFTVDSFLSISLIDAAVEFGSLDPGVNENTSDGSPQPFRMENTGNIFGNITINGSAIFTSVGFPNESYQFQIRENESGAFNISYSQVNYTNMANSTDVHVQDLDWHNYANDFLTDINITIPDDEPSGLKTASITFVFTG